MANNTETTAMRRFVRWTIFILAALAFTSSASGVTIFAMSRKNVLYPSEPFLYEDEAMEAFSLLLSVVNTVLIIGIRFLQDMSFRWKQVADGTLERNHNMRLRLSALSAAGASRRDCLLFCAFLLCAIVVQTSSQLVFVRSIIGEFDRQYEAEADADKNHFWSVNPEALLFLGAAYLGLASLGYFAYSPSGGDYFPAWNYHDPRQTVSIVETDLIHRGGGSITTPAQRVTRPWDLSHTIKGPYVFSMLIALSVALGLPLFAIYGRGHRDNDKCGCPGDDPFHAQWRLSMKNRSDYTELDLTFQDVGLSLFVAFLCEFLVQTILVLAFHPIEYFVDIRADQRDVSLPTGQGAEPAANWQSFCIRYWLTAVVTLLQGGLHWMVGQAIVPYAYNELSTAADDVEFGLQTRRGLDDMYIHVSSSRTIYASTFIGAAVVVATCAVFWPVDDQGEFGGMPTRRPDASAGATNEP